MLSRVALAVLLGVSCGGCAASRPPDAPLMSPAAANGQALAAAVATPFYAVFKATACLVSAVVVVPSTAALALTDRPERDEERAALYAGLGRNCYGSYALQPI
jgi:hypothetical protein